MTDYNLVLEPGKQIKPHVDADVGIELVQRLYGLEVTEIKALNSYDDVNLYIKVDNSSVLEPEQDCPHGYVLKILNALDSQKIGHVEAQNAMMLHLKERGVNCPQPVRTVEGSWYSKEQFRNPESQEGEPSVHIVRLLTYVPGELLVSVDYTTDVLFQVGQFAVTISNGLLNFGHEGLACHRKIWNMSEVPELEDFVFAVEDLQRRNLVTEIVDAFKREVVPQYPNLSKGPLHGDLNEQNILVTKSENKTIVSGVLDFGDIQHSFHLFELAIVICYMMLDCKTMDVTEAPGYVLAGYSSLRAIPSVEFDLLKTCVAARFCQSLVLGAYSYLQTKDPYVLITQKRGWACLELLWKAPTEELKDNWKKTIRSYLHDLQI